jgi:hypothetical protein
MAYGSFAPLYTHIKQELMLKRERTQYFVLECLAQHADPFGFCYPGNQHIGEMCGYGPTTIEKAIDELVQRGWIKCYETNIPYRRGMVQRDIQLSPEVLYIREELTDYAWSIWNGATRNFETEMEIEINYVQPESESITRIQNQLTSFNYPESVSTTTTQPVPLKKAHASRPAARPLPIAPMALELPAQDEPVQREAQPNQREAQNNQRGEDTPNSTPPQFRRTPPQDLTQFHLPLDQSAEDLAQRLRSEFGTRIAQARELVAAYGIDMVMVGIDYVYQERKNARIQNAFGLLKWWMKAHAIAPDDTPQKEKTWLDYVCPKCFSSPCSCEMLGIS